jgi:hypothetical protein
MVRPRPLLAVLCVVLVVGSGGCLDVLTGEESLSFEADPTAVDDGALSETGYELVRSESPNRTVSVSVAGESREASIATEIREYGRNVSVGGQQAQVARFSVYTVPGVSVAGQTVNPVSDWSTRRLVDLLVSSNENLRNIRFESNRTVRFLGSDRTVTTYRARAASGPDGNVTVHAATVSHDGDYVVAAGVHPTALDERSRIDALLAGLRHPA